MSTNLVSQIMQFLTPEIISRIASVLGLDRGKVQSGISAAVPALLAGLSGVATRPAGAQRLADAANQHNDTLANFANMLSVGGQPSIAGQGSKLLTTLLGEHGEGALAGAIGKFAGLGEGPTKSLLGMLAPVVMGGIAQQGNHLSAEGISNLFASQKDTIAAALPSGLGKLLSGSGLLDAVGGAARTGAATVGQVARDAGSAAHAAGQAGQRAAMSATSTSRSWLYWLIPAAAVVALLLYLVGRPAEQVAERSTAAVETVGVAAANTDIGKSVNASLDSLRTTLSGITDAASAQAALPKLQNVMAQINKVGGRIEQLSTEQRQAIAGVVQPAVPMIKEWVDKALAVPGVAEVLKPTLDDLKTKFAKLVA